jgi:hypothetical protein
MSRKAKSPSLLQDLLMLGDIYLTLGWLAIQRWRFGPLWPWEGHPRQRKALALPREVTPLRPPRG